MLRNHWVKKGLAGAGCPADGGLPAARWLFELFPDAVQHHLHLYYFFVIAQHPGRLRGAGVRWSCGISGDRVVYGSHIRGKRSSILRILPDGGHRQRGNRAADRPARCAASRSLSGCGYARLRAVGAVAGSELGFFNERLSRHGRIETRFSILRYRIFSM